MNIEQITQLYNEGKTQEAQAMIIDAFSSEEMQDAVSKYTQAVIDIAVMMGKMTQAVIDSLPEWFKVLAAFDYNKSKRREMYYRRYARHGKK